MNEKMALDLIQQYIDGWKQNDLQRIISSLSENCVVIESHGPTYHGIEEIRHWFDLWLKAENRITQWDLLSFYFHEKEKTASCEWEFSCISNKKIYEFPGISIVKFSAQKIAFLHEYRMTQQAYAWEKNRLISE